MTRIDYGYPSSETGGMFGAYLVYDEDTEIGVKYPSLSTAVKQAIDYGSRPVVINYGLPSAVPLHYRDLGVIHALDL